MIVHIWPVRSWIPAQARNIRPYRHDARGVAVRAHLTKVLGVLVWGERNSRPGYDLLICCHSELGDGFIVACYRAFRQESEVEQRAPFFINPSRTPHGHSANVLFSPDPNRTVDQIPGGLKGTGNEPIV